MPQPLSPATRRLVGVLGVLIFLLAWIIAAATLGGRLIAWPWWAQAAYYLAAGVGWVFPLRPVFLWMARDASARDDRRPGERYTQR